MQWIMAQKSNIVFFFCKLYKNTVWYFIDKHAHKKTSDVKLRAMASIFQNSTGSMWRVEL